MFVIEIPCFTKECMVCTLNGYGNTNQCYYYYAALVCVLRSLTHHLAIQSLKVSFSSLKVKINVLGKSC